MPKRSALAALLACLLVAGCGGHSHKIQAGTRASGQSATGSVHPKGWGSTPPGFSLPAPALTATPTAEGFDTITLSTLAGLHPFALGGYTSGFWPTFLPLRAAFPSAHTLSIAINASHHADCLDVEPGDAVPSQAGPWARADIAAGFSRPCLYADLSNMPAVRASLAAAGLSRSRYILWLAWYRNVPGLVADYDIVQWTDHAYGRNLDEDTFSLSALEIAHPPYVPAPVLPVCFTHRMSRSACAAVKAKIASQQRAAASSERAYIVRGCPGIVQRRDWFAAHLSKPPASRHAYRAAALGASQRAYQRNACGVFSQRQNYFTTASARLRAAS